MPKRAPLPGTDILPDDILPVETSQAESDSLALRAFFYDYCFTSVNPNLSRGFLSLLERHTYQLCQKSDLIKVCQAVSFATHGKPLNRPMLVHRASIFNQELLGSLARALEDPTRASAVETKCIAMLLGLYQMTVGDVTNRGNHNAHAKGLTALLKVGMSPAEILGTFQPDDKSPRANGFKRKKIFGVFSVPAVGNLEELLLSLDSLRTWSETLPDEKSVIALNDACIALNQRFVEWETTRLDEFKPITIRTIGQSHGYSKISVGSWPGEVHTYFDLYVAGIWNLFRTARLCLIALIIKYSNSLKEYNISHEHMGNTNSIVQDIMASIPYHLTDNLHAFIDQSEGNQEITDPGKFLGGLLLMHPLYIVSELPLVSDDMKLYVRKCLMWIGNNMGFGQATLLANTPGIDKEFLISGCLLIWSGFLQ
ncbi:hypothetical protein BGZ60DRAFT_372142 [Tricladium varicosporioides]|nr:hypothetical protein BGZ60DRAFT_372142 [Hymenoscyphus varicosporioides]